MGNPELVQGRSVALAHDYLLVMRGAERTFEAMAQCWPDAPVHTLLYDRDATAGRFDRHRIKTSMLQRTGVRQKGFRRLLPFFPAAADRMSVGDADVVISSSSAFAHGIGRDDTERICYCHSPFRYVWHERRRALSEFPAPLRATGARVLDHVRAWDLESSQRVTHYIANSKITQQRIGDFYEREASIVHPPVAVDRFSIGTPEDFFLIVCELVSHKNVDVALAAAERAGAKVKVVGTGPERARLEARFGDTAEFLGRVGDSALEDLYSRCLAFLMPAVEEFGIAAVEAMASGRPVVASAEGGALEFVTPLTGVLVPVRDVDALAEALRFTDFESFDPVRLRHRAESFSTASFQLKLVDEVERALAGRDTVEIPALVPAPVRTGRFDRLPGRIATDAA